MGCYDGSNRACHSCFGTILFPIEPDLARTLGESGLLFVGITNAPTRRLIVNADDFGQSSEVNEAVVRAHVEGILTTASLMVKSPRKDEAIALARKHPRLGVGLHLVLVAGRSALKPTEIPDLVNHHYRFPDSTLRVGLRYFFLPGLRDQLRREVYAQIQKFQATGLTLDHVNGHLQIHLHPTILKICIRAARHFGLRHIRLTRDPALLNFQIADGQWLYRLSHALVFAVLCASASPKLKEAKIRSTDRVFGLLQNAGVDQRYLCRLLERLPAGNSELYAHPSTNGLSHELNALLSSKVREIITRRQIELIRYQDI